MPAAPKPSFSEVERARRAFASILRDFIKARGRARYHNPAPDLPAEALEGCTVLPSRLHLLDTLDKGLTLAEIGPGAGAFSAELLARTAPAMLHLMQVDPGALSHPDVRAELTAETPRIKPHMGEVETSLAKFPDGYFDAIYINGDHDYPAVQRDIALSAPKLKDSGALIFHAYNTWSNVSMYHCGVARAVHEFCLENPWKFRYLALEPMMYNDVMLVRSDV